MACDSISSSSDVSDRLLVPPDSPGSSVSTTLQEEYDELLKYAVVMPSGTHTLGATAPSKDTFPLFRQLIGAAQNLGGTQPGEQTFGSDADRTLEEGTASASEAEVNGSGHEGDNESERGVHVHVYPHHSSSTPRDTPTQDIYNHELNNDMQMTQQNTVSEVLRSQRVHFTQEPTSQPLRQPPPPALAHNSGTAEQLQHAASSQSAAGEPSRHFQPNMQPVNQDDSVTSSRYTEDSQMVYTTGVDPDITRMENMLDQWTLDLKRNVLAEFGQSKIKTLEHHKQEMIRLKERHNAEKNQLYNELESLKELLHTYEKTMGRKDQVISNLTGAIQKQREKHDLLRTFCEWRSNLNDKKQEAFASNLARKHHERALQRRAWVNWHGLIENKWRARVEKACQAKAQEVCLELTNQYEATIAELSGQLAAARDEVSVLNVQREQYEESMKKAFMRGVCALNMEAMTMFSEDERSTAPNTARTQDHDEHTSHQHQQQPSHQQQPPFHQPADHFAQSSHTADGQGGSGGVNGVVGGGAPRGVGVTSQQGVSRVVSSVQQPTSTQSKAFTTGGAARKTKSSAVSRVSAKVDTGRGKSAGSSATPLAPPMTSVVVERHPPVNKQTIGQAIASQFPAKGPSQTNPSGQRPAGRKTNATGVHVKAPHLQTIKVVE